MLKDALYKIAESWIKGDEAYCEREIKNCKERHNMDCVK